MTTLLSLSLVACNQAPEPTPVLTSPPTPTVQAVVQGVAPSGPVLGTLDVTAIDLGFSPNFFNVDNPGRYTIKVHNKGQILHDVTFPDGTKLAAKPGETQQADVMVGPEGVKFICSIPGHKESGMVGTISVGGKTVAVDKTGEEAGGGHGGPAVATDVQPDQNAPAYKLFDATAPKRLEGDVHDIDLVIKEMPMTVAKGFVQQEASCRTRWTSTPARSPGTTR